jgi:hypothetical protein
MIFFPTCKKEKEEHGRAQHQDRKKICRSLRADSSMIERRVRPLPFYLKIKTSGAATMKNKGLFPAPVMLILSRKQKQVVLRTTGAVAISAEG